jgi:hypothetical protein
MKIEFSVSMYPSCRPGQHAISITNKNDESLVVGYTSDVEAAKSALSQTFKNASGWTRDDCLSYHTLAVEVELQKATRT